MARTALSVYRALFRAAGITFRGDDRMLQEAQRQIRARFRDNRSLSPDAAAPAVTLASEIATTLRTTIVQGEHTGGNMFRLRIHKDTERGDNASIKMGPCKGSGRNR